MSEFFTWEMLRTYAGAAALTGIATQFLKGMFAELPTQMLAYFVALVVLILANLFTGVLSPDAWALAPFNAVIVATAASGTYDGIQRIEKFKGGQ